MPWETRRRGTCYYTRSKRIDGRVVREYIGIGPVAELIAQEDETERQQQAQKRQEWLIEKEAVDILDQDLKALDVACRSLMQQHLEAAGYHQHCCGEWRKRRKKPHV